MHAIEDLRLSLAYPIPDARDRQQMADKSRTEFKRQSLGDSFVSSSRSVSLVAAVRNSVLSSAWPSGQMRSWRTARRRRSSISATRDQAQMRHRGTISDHHSQAKQTPNRKAKIKRGPAIVLGCRLSHGSANKQSRAMGEKMMRKTGRLIHACPAQIAALAESFFITGALETQMSNDVSRGVRWPPRYRTSPNDWSWPCAARKRPSQS